MSASKKWMAGLMFGCACVALDADAGVFVERVLRNSADGSEVPGIDMYVENGMLRVEDLRGKRPHVTIFKDQVIYELAPGKKTYTVMDKAAIDKMGGQMNAAQQQMQAELAKIPPEQRAMVEQMMKQRGGAAPGMGAAPGTAPPKKTVITSSDAGKTESVNGRSCHLWNIKRDNVLVTQLCVVPYASLPGASQVRDAIAKLSAFTEELTDSLKQAGGGAGEEFVGLSKVNGMPVLTRRFTDGQADANVTIVKTWTTRANPAALFEVPGDYKRTH